MTQYIAGALMVLFLLFPRHCVAGRFVEITAEITFDNWDYWSVNDKDGLLTRHGPSATLSGIAETRRCVVGPDTWMMEGVRWDDKETLWFTGTNMVRYSVNTNDTAGGQSFPAVVRRSTRIDPSLDGNPEATGIIPYIDVTGKVCWLAFCSGPCFRQTNHKIFPPGPFWVESAVHNGVWKEQANVFPDRLGLPQRVDLISTNNQTVFQYQVHQTTNVLGWNFPLEFYGVQYIGGGDHGWRVDLSFKGKITAIHETSEPKIPAEVFTAKRESSRPNSR